MKKWMALLLALVLVLSLAACGGESGDTEPAQDPEPTEQEVTEEPAEEPAEESAEEPAEEPTEEPVEEPAEEPAAEEAAFTQVKIGDTVTLEGVGLELTTTGFQYGDEMIPGWSFSNHDSSNKYFWMGGTVVNVGTETLDTLGVECAVDIIFDDTYTYTGDLMFENTDGLGPFGQTNVYFWADVPPAMLERYQTVKVQFGYNDGFGDYDWQANSERVVTGYNHCYEFIAGDAAAATAQ